MMRAFLRQPLVIAVAWIGCAIGGWLVFDAVRAALPVWLRLAVAATVLVFGVGAGLTARLLAPLPTVGRIVLGFSFGVTFVPVLAHVLGILGWLELYPYIAVSLLAVALALWHRHGHVAEPSTTLRRAPLLLAVLAAAIGAVAFANRLTTSNGDQVIYGEYDTYDLTYYAEIGAELSHTVPPASPFYAGRQLNHSFYPHLVLALVHRFGDVPLLDLYFRYAWPAFLVLVVLTCFVFVESISSRYAALVTAVLFGMGSDLSYVARWIFNLSSWDNVIWSHNFQGAGAEVLLYNNWTPALITMFAGFYAAHAAIRGGRAGWILAAGVSFGVTVLSKPWIFASVMAALAATMVVSWRDRTSLRRLSLVGLVSTGAAAPLLYRTTTLFEDAQVVFAPAFFPIPLVMVGRLGLDRYFLDWATALGASGAWRPGMAGLLAAPVFALGSLGFRLVGLPALWRCLWRPTAHDPIWRLLAWSVVAALAASSFIVSVPYHETTQIHQLALFLLALFAGRALTAAPLSGRRFAATLVVLALAVPSTLHYVHRKWTDQSHPFADVTHEELPVVALLRQTDPQHTVVLHNRPTRSFPIGIVSARRSLLSWSNYVRGSSERRLDVETFYSSGVTPAVALDVLRKYRPTHVVEYRLRDHLNEEVRDQLELMFSNPVIALYRVPEALRGGS